MSMSTRALPALVGILATLTAAASAQEPAAPDCAEQVALRVQRHYDAVRDLSADFTQTSSVASLGGREGEQLHASGKVVFAKPGRMRWSYEKPEPSLVITDGRNLWTYEPGRREAQHVTAAEGFLSGAAIQFLLGEGQIVDAFRVSADDCSGERVVLRLEPREPTSYERLGLEVDAQKGLIHSTEVVDLFGNATRVALSNVRINTDPSSALFTFEAPEGVRVIEIPTAPSAPR
jgi:outer membrane lipoprotein carrier protein